MFPTGAVPEVGPVERIHTVAKNKWEVDESIKSVETIVDLTVSKGCVVCRL